MVDAMVRRTNNVRNDAGMTLVELVVSMMILTIFLLVTYSALISLTRASIYVQEHPLTLNSHTPKTCRDIVPDASGEMYSSPQPDC